MVTTSAEGLRGPARVGTKCKAHRHGRARRPRLGHHRKGRREDVAEGLRQERAQRVLGIDCLVMGPHRRQDRKHPENQEHDPPRRVTDPCYPFKHRSLAHGLAVVAWSPTVSTVMLDVRSDRAPGWTAGHRSLHRGDLYLTHTDAGAPPTAKRPRRRAGCRRLSRTVPNTRAIRKKKHDEKYDLGDSHGGGGDRSTLII